MGDKKIRELIWPNGDYVAIERWRLNFVITGLSQTWWIGFTLTWHTRNGQFEIGDIQSMFTSKCPSDFTNFSPSGGSFEPRPESRIQQRQACPTALIAEQTKVPGREAGEERAIVATDESAPVFNFATEAGRIAAMVKYRKAWSVDSWNCSDAAIARTAIVDTADLSKWKKGLLPPGSQKARRIEKALMENQPPHKADRCQL